MKKRAFLRIKNLHLIISSVVVIPTAFVYGIYPAYTLPVFFDFTVNTTDLANVFRALMGLYLGMALIWLFGIFKHRFWRVATITNMVFMGGLALGRFASLIADGIPSKAFVIGLAGEFILAVFGLIQLNKHSRL